MRDDSGLAEQPLSSEPVEVGLPASAEGEASDVGTFGSVPASLPVLASIATPESTTGTGRISTGTTTGFESVSAWKGSPLYRAKTECEPAESVTENAAPPSAS